MPHTIIEILTGQFPDGTAVSTPPTEHDFYASIEAHLEYLLNSRRETLSHLEGYGLPDIGAIFENLPYSAHALVHAVQENIDRFEPRLQNITIRKMDKIDPSNRLFLELIGETRARTQVKGVVSFVNGGKAQVSLQYMSTSHA